MNVSDGVLKRNADKSQLIESLKDADNIAIQLIGKKIKPDIKRLVFKHNLSEMEVEEVLHDAIIILISSIRKGKYQDQGYHPAAYALGIARNLILNKAKRTKLKTVSLEDGIPIISDFSPEEYLETKERLSMIEALLNKLDYTCKQLIQIKYFDNLKDKEILNNKLTHFTSVTSIKSKRSQCMRKLSELAKSSGIKSSY